VLENAQQIDGQKEIGVMQQRPYNMQLPDPNQEQGRLKVRKGPWHMISEVSARALHALWSI